MLDEFLQHAKDYPSDVLGLTAMAIYLWPSIAAEKNIEVNCDVITFKNTVNSICNTNILNKNNFRRNVSFCVSRSNNIFSVDLHGKMNFDMEKRDTVSIDDFVKMIRLKTYKEGGYKRSSKQLKINKDINSLIAEELTNIKKIEIETFSTSVIQLVHENQINYPVIGLRVVVHPEGVVEIVYP